jgi:ribosomal protein S11
MKKKKKKKMMEKTSLVKKILIYTKQKYLLRPAKTLKRSENFKNKGKPFIFRSIFFAAFHFLSGGCFFPPLLKNKSILSWRNFHPKSLVTTFLKGLDFIFIIKVGKNFFINWFDAFGRLKLTKSLVTLGDSKKTGSKKQKGFSTYFLLRKFTKTLIRYYKLSKVSVLFKGSLGIRQKKTFLAGILHSGLKVVSLIDITSIPFNGCRYRREKRK